MNGFNRRRLMAKLTVGLGVLLGVANLTGCERTAMHLLRSASGQPDPARVKVIRQRPRAGQVVVIDRTGHKHAIAADSVWGYQTDQGETYRLYGLYEYEVLQREPLLIYRTEEWASDAVWEYHYFSLSATGDIHALGKNTCRRVFRKDECMLRLLNQMHERDLLRRDSHGSYGLANAYSFCHCRGTAD